MICHWAIGTISSVCGRHLPLLVECLVVLVVILSILQVLMDTKLEMAACLSDVLLVHLESCGLETCQVGCLASR